MFKKKLELFFFKEGHNAFFFSQLVQIHYNKKI